MSTTSLERIAANALVHMYQSAKEDREREIREALILQYELARKRENGEGESRMLDLSEQQLVMNNFERSGK